MSTLLSTLPSRPLVLLLAAVTTWAPAAPLALDSSFGTAGVVMPSFPTSPSPDSVGMGRVTTVQADGRIVVAGQTTVGGGSNIAVIRYLADGTLDTSFGTQGITVVDRPGLIDNATCLLRLPDDKFLIAGHTAAPGGLDILLIRLDANGGIDTTFGTAGVVQIDFAGLDEAAHGMTLDAMGRILLTGGAVTGANEDAFILRCLAADGSLDTTFGTGGRTTVAIGPSTDQARDVAVQADGKIVITGYTRISNNDAFALIRFHEDGTRDETFGALGIVTTQLTTAEDRAQSLLIQPDGKIIAAGWATVSGEAAFAIARYLDTGALDAGFGTGGSATTSVLSGDDYGMTVALVDTDKLVVTGGAYTTSGQFAAVRYTAAGVLDSSFGAAGKRTVAISGASIDASGLAVQADGGLLIAGTVNGAAGADFGLLRLTPGGDIDNSFDGDGRAVTDLAQQPAFSTARAVLVQPDGKILTAGAATQSGIYHITVLRHLADGTLDPGFGTNGRVELAPGFAHCLALQADGGILVGGEAFLGGFYQFSLHRLLPNGTLDSSFATGGHMHTMLGLGDSGIYSLAVQTDGAIVTGGYAYFEVEDGDTMVNRIDFGIARFLPNGTLDPAFGTGGKVVITPTANQATDTATDTVSTILLQPDGKIFAVGVRVLSSAAATQQIAIVRLTTAGAADTTFSGDGKFIQTTALVTGQSTRVQRAVLQTDGKLVIAGTQNVYGDADFFCVRYNAGLTTFDNTFGTSGKTFIPIGSFLDVAFDLHQDAMGRLTLAGYSQDSSDRLALVRLTSAGVLDTSFDIDGIATFDLGTTDDRAYALALQPDGKLLLAGDTSLAMALARVTETTSNQPPMAMDDSAFALPGSVILIPVLANDTDADMHPLSIQSFTQPASGGVVDQVGDMLRFTATASFTGAAFTCTVSDGNGGTDTADVLVNPVMTFAQWQIARFGPDAGDPEIAGDLKDPDHDGLSNLLEYALGRNPLVPDTTPPCTASVVGGRLVLTCQRWAAASDITLEAEFCTDAASWSTLGVTQQETANDGILQTLEYTGPLEMAARQVGRLRVTRAP